MAAVGIIVLGATGFGAGELLRLCAGHAEVEIVQLVSSSQAGEAVERVHPHLKGFYQRELASKPSLELLNSFAHKFIVSALPHAASGETLAGILNDVTAANVTNLRVVDLSGDFRLHDQKLHQEYYPHSKALPELRSAFVYGLPELNRALIRKARFIANPGCLATATILALAPLTRAGLISRASVTASTGSSGAGRGLRESVHHAVRHSNLFAYKALSHQHEPEVMSALEGKLNGLAFVAQSAPMSRGISIVASAQLESVVSATELQDRFIEFYRDAPFVRIISSSPEVQNVVGSNFCDLSVQARGREVVVLAVLDNLVKGMSGQALQNINLVAGLNETAGLWTPGLRPI